MITDKNCSQRYAPHFYLYTSPSSQKLFVTCIIYIVSTKHVIKLYHCFWWNYMHMSLSRGVFIGTTIHFIVYSHGLPLSLLSVWSSINWKCFITTQIPDRHIPAEMAKIAFDNWNIYSSSWAVLMFKGQRKQKKIWNYDVLGHLICILMVKTKNPYRYSAQSGIISCRIT